MIQFTKYLFDTIMKKLFIVIFILLWAGLGLWWFFSWGKESLESWSNDSKQKIGTIAPSTYEEILAENEKEKQRDSELYNKAISSRNSKLCEGIESISKKNECRDSLIAIQAEWSGSLETCNTIINPDTATACRDIVAKNQASKTENKAFCKNVSDPALGQSCREEIDEKLLTKAIESGNITREFCNTLEQKYIQNCLWNISKSNDTNLYTKALSSGNINNCTSISDEKLRSTCRDTILLKQALNTNSMAYCNMMQDPEKKDYCLSHIETKNESTLFKEYITTLNLDGCKNLTDINLKNRCNDMVVLSLARNNKDPGLCQTLSNTGMIAMCERSAQ